ncbi:MAG: NTP transferase domain-containing protein [Candidatus Moranbacteria bacterium]|nr:NTP transferase domain-containing protein [Candidatus Moranbacteria bacterium]
MQAVILAAGRGTRMGVLTDAMPKPMVLLLGKPLLEWKLAMLPAEIDEVILVVGYRSNQIRAYFGKQWKGRTISYVEQKELNGTGGVLPLLRGVVQGAFLLMNGDDLYHLHDLESGVVGGNIALLGLEIARPFDIGIIETDERGQFIQVREHVTADTPGLVNTGAYFLDEGILDIAPVRYSATEYGLPQTLAVYGQTVPITILKARAWQPIGRPDDIPKGEEFLKKYWNV